MCPNRRVNRNILPNCGITNRMALYEMMDYMHTEEVAHEEVSAQLRERYEIFRQVAQNYPMPIETRLGFSSIYDFTYDPVEQRRLLNEARRRASIQSSMSDSSPSVSSVLSSISSLSADCEYYGDVVAQLDGNSDAVQNQSEENGLLESSDEGN